MTKHYCDICGCEVDKVEAIEISEEDLLKLVCQAENYSNHPISQSIKKYYNKWKEVDFMIERKSRSCCLEFPFGEVRFQN